MYRILSVLLCSALLAGLTLPLPRAVAETVYQRTILADSPVAYWSFDEPLGSSRTINQGSQGTVLDGIYVNVALEQPSAFDRLGTAADFNGFSSVVDLSSNISTWLNQTASMEFWIKTRQSGASQQVDMPAIAGRDSNGNDRDVWWGVNIDGRMGIRRGDRAANMVLTPDPINDDQWHYLMITRDQLTGVMSVYLDGNPAPVAFRDDTDNFPINPSYDLLGKGHNNNSFVDATIDELAVYDYVLTGNHAQAHFAAASVPEPNGLVLFCIGLFGILVYVLVVRGRTRVVRKSTV